MPEYKIKPQQDERNAQHLSHVDRHGVLELYLTFFEKLDEETESEYQGDAKPETNAQGNVVGIPMISEFIRLARRMKPAATGAAMPNISSTSK